MIKMVEPTLLERMAGLRGTTTCRSAPRASQPQHQVPHIFRPFKPHASAAASCTTVVWMPFPSTVKKLAEPSGSEKQNETRAACLPSPWLRKGAIIWERNSSQQLKCAGNTGERPKPMLSCVRNTLGSTEKSSSVIRMLSINVHSVPPNGPGTRTLTRPSAVAVVSVDRVV
jgi:hypothetical protein